MKWKSFPSNLLEPVAPEIVESKLFEARYTSNHGVSPVVEGGKIIIMNRAPSYKFNSNGYPCEMQTACVYSRAFWLSKTPEIIAIGVKAFGYGGSQSMRLYRKAKDKETGSFTWVSTTRAHKDVASALLRLMRAHGGDLDPSKIYDVE